MLRFFALKYELAYSFILPPGVPKERIQALQKAFDDTMQDPDYLAASNRLALPHNSLKSAEVSAIIRKIETTPEPIVAHMRAILDTMNRK
jgi:tripartite-type tricarboxylate transporter receptor subunit TctC